MIGEEAWRYAPTLDAVTARAEPGISTRPPRRANDVFASGTLDKATRAGSGKPDHYVYDPLDTSLGRMGTRSTCPTG